MDRIWSLEPYTISFESQLGHSNKSLLNFLNCNMRIATLQNDYEIRNNVHEVSGLELRITVLPPKILGFMAKQGGLPQSKYVLNIPLEIPGQKISSPKKG